MDTRFEITHETWVVYKDGKLLEFDEPYDDPLNQFDNAIHDCYSDALEYKEAFQKAFDPQIKSHYEIKTSTQTVTIYNVTKIEVG